MGDVKCTFWPPQGRERLLGSCLVIFTYAFEIVLCFIFVAEYLQSLNRERSRYWDVCVGLFPLISVGISVWVPWGSRCVWHMPEAGGAGSVPCVQHTLLLLSRSPEQLLLVLYIGRAQLLVQLWGFFVFLMFNGVTDTVSRCWPITSLHVLPQPCVFKTHLVVCIHVQEAVV